MASLDNLEGDVTEGAAALIAVALVVVIVIAYMAWKKLTIPASAYPDIIAGNFATGVDREMTGVGISKTSFAEKVDGWLADLNIWVTENLPRAADSKGWAAYEAQFSDAGDGMGIATGTSQTNQASYVNLGGQ